MQIAFDTASLRPVVLVSYQGEAATATPALHAWNGKEWLYVSMQDFREVNFLQVRPTRAILVGDANLLPADLVAAVSAWCPQVFTVAELQPAGLVNALGEHLSFSSKEWEWMAERYNMSLQDLNAERRQESWYNQPGYRDHLTRSIENPPVRRHGGRPARRATAAPAPVSEAVPPAEVMPPEEAAPVMTPHLSLPAAEEEPAPAVEEKAPGSEPATPAVEDPPASSEKKAKRSSKKKAEPADWQEKATATEAPVK